MSDTLSRLTSIVGGENVIENPDFFSSSVWFKTGENQLTPDFLVKAASTEQVQEVVKLANELALPLIPVSSSAPHKTGGVSVDVPGAIVLDMSGMKKIIRIDRTHCIAVVEPGVTWEELSIELAKKDLRITHPLLPKKGKSVIASLVDREPCISPKYQYNMTEPLRSMEIIFGTGDKVLTGNGGHMLNNDEKWAGGEVPITQSGPHQFDFLKMVSAAQGSMGVVTMASLKLEPLGKEEKPVFVESDSYEKLTDFLYKTLKFRFGDEVCVFNKKALASILADKAEDVDSVASKLSKWTALVNIKWGALRAKEKIAVQEADLTDIAQATGLVLSMTVAGIPAVKVTEKVLAINGDSEWKSKSTGAAKEIFFLSTLDKISAQLKKAAEVADKHGYAFSDCPIYLQPMHQGVAANCCIALPITEDQADSAELKAFYDEMSRELAGVGAFYSRPYGIWSEIMYDSNAQHTQLTKQMKDIFDPGYVMNPGKLCF